MNTKQELKQAREDISHLQEMCRKLVYENVRLNKKLNKADKGDKK